MTSLLLVFGLLNWPASGDARTTAERVVADEALQAEMPGEAKARPRPMTPSRATSGGGGGPRTSSPPAADSGAALGPVVLWTVGGLLVVGLVALVMRERMGTSAVEARAQPLPAAPAPPERTIVDEADALAAAGRFAEAVHALLLRTIEALGRQTPVPRALTSREILDRPGLPGAARDAFGDLVLAVEVTRFGGRPADADDYARCVACFDRIRTALGAR